MKINDCIIYENYLDSNFWKNNLDESFSMKMQKLTDFFYSYKAISDYFKLSTKNSIDAKERNLFLSLLSKIDAEISCALIVRNEERTIKRYLESVYPLFDEVIIVDTGSTDNTIPIINEMNLKNVKIFFHEWQNSFAEARVYAMRKASKKWIFF